jgi:hypothetical protein
MATSMDPPQPLKKKNYLDAVKSSDPQEIKEYLAVPGIQGERGEPGLKEIKVIGVIRGHKAQKVILVRLVHKESVASQEKVLKGMIQYLDSIQVGLIIKIYQTEQRNLGPQRGDDGWVSITFNPDEKILDNFYMPKGSNQLWQSDMNMFNFKSLKLGAKVDIRYDFTISTESNYTELWFRTFNEKYENSPTSYVANLKYQYSYDMSVCQTLYIDEP